MLFQLDASFQCSRNITPLPTSLLGLLALELGRHPLQCQLDITLLELRQIIVVG
jgi:hypothetical protein